MKKAEPVPKGGHDPRFAWRASAGALRWMKRLVRRQRRRAESRDAENVPMRFTSGWYW